MRISADKVTEIFQAYIEGHLREYEDHTELVSEQFYVNGHASGSS